MKMFIKNLELGKEKLSICEKYLGNTSYQDRNMLHRSINELDSPSDINSFPLKQLVSLTDPSILERLIKSCEEFSYQDSFLYENIKYLIKKKDYL